MKSRFFVNVLVSAIAFTPFYISGAVLHTEKQSDGILITTDAGVIKLQPWSAWTIRVQVAPGAEIPPTKSLAVTGSPASGKWHLQEDGQTIRLIAQNIGVSVDKGSTQITFWTPDGRMLLQESASGHSFVPAHDSTRDGLEFSASFKRNPAERYFGVGVIGKELQQSNAVIELANDNARIRVPVLYSSRGYGLFWDNPSRGKLKLATNELTWSFSAGNSIDYYVMAGPMADQVIAEYRYLTGGVPLFPKWAYGFWFSKNKFERQQEILDAAKEFRARQFPVDMLIQDYYYWLNGKEGANWGSHEFDASRYPDPKGMIDQLHEEYQMHFMAVIWAKFHPDTEHFKELAAANGLFPPHKDWAGPLLQYYDPFNLKARDIYGSQVMGSLLSLGLDGFWMDGAEPEMDSHTFASFNSGIGPVSRVMSAFPLMHVEGVYKSQRGMTGQKRVVLLPRSAWAGMQRDAACNWTGDIKQNWQTLAWQIEGLQNYSITGLPYITTDVGGYEPDGISESDRELFIRWFEWGTFCPIFRVHGVERPFPWQYGKETEAILKKYDVLRYRLLPYIYSQAGAITRKNGTMMRPLVMDFRDDAKALDTWDEYMFGPALLVCPVYQCSREPVSTTIDQWADIQDKSGGVTATYIINGDEAGFRVELKEERPMSYREMEMKNEEAGFRAKVVTDEQLKAKKVRIEGTYTPNIDGKLELEFAGDNYAETLSLDHQMATPDVPRERFQFPNYPLNCKAGVPIRFAFESQEKRPAFRIVRPALNAQSKNVFLPGKEDWYDFWTGRRIASGQTIEVQTPLNTIPLFVRAGSILPMGPTVEYANERPADPIELRIYAGANGKFTLYEDAGDNYDYEKGAFSTIQMEWNDSKQTLNIGARKGSFPGMLKQRRFNVILVCEGHGTESDETHEATLIRYTGKAVEVKMRKGGGWH